MSGPAMPKLPPFNAEATCPKCGHDDVDVRHHEAMEYAGISGCACKGGSLGLGQREHLGRKCNRCGFWWAQATLTARRTPIARPT